MQDTAAPHQEHFESLDRQAEAARLGMWVFLASEVLLFSGLFALYANYRAEFPAAFGEGVEYDNIWIGSGNTVILIVSSFFVAYAVHVLRRNRPRAASYWLVGALLLGLSFLGLKLYEYHLHLSHGISPGGEGHFFETHPGHGLKAFFNLYYITTGAHAVHVAVGVMVLAFFCIWLWRRGFGASYAHRLEMAALYWHLVDAMWIFIWPLYYLMKAH